MARPKKIINQRQFESLCAIQCTQKEICNVLGTTDKTLNNWCNDTYNLSFLEVYEQKRDVGRMSLRRNQFKLAEGGNPTMQIWLGKQVLKQSENPVMDNIKLKELELKIKEFELKEKLMLRQLEEGSSHSDVAQALREVFGNENNK